MSRRESTVYRSLSVREAFETLPKQGEIVLLKTVSFILVWHALGRFLFLLVILRHNDVVQVIYGVSEI